MSSLTYADIEPADSSRATTIASTLQQLSLSFGLASGSLVAGWWHDSLPQTDQQAVAGALHHAFLTLSGFTVLSSLSLWTLYRWDGDSISGNGAVAPL